MYTNYALSVMDGTSTPILSGIAYGTQESLYFSTGNVINVLSAIQLIFDDGE